MLGCGAGGAALTPWSGLLFPSSLHSLPFQPLAKAATRKVCHASFTPVSVQKHTPQTRTRELPASEAFSPSVGLVWTECSCPPGVHMLTL